MGREMGGRFKREGRYVNLWLIHVEVWKKTKFCKGIILQLKNRLKKTKQTTFLLVSKKTQETTLPFLWSTGKDLVYFLFILMKWGSCLTQSIEIDQKPDKKFGQGFIGSLTAAEGDENKHQVPLPAPHGGGWASSSSYGVSIGVCPGVRPEGGLSGLPTCLVMFRAGDMSNTLFFPLTPCFCSWLFRSDSWVFGLFESCYLQYVPTAQAQSYFWFLIISLYFLAQNGLRSQVPGCLYSFKCL